MLRQVVSIVLLPCLLLSQSAVRGHAHTGDSPDGCDPRPHFHVHSHSHHCDHTTPADGLGYTPLDDHDSTALYLAAEDVTSAKRATVAVAPADAVGWVALPVRGGVTFGPLVGYLIHPGHSPPTGTGSPLYLTLCTLLI